MFFLLQNMHGKRERFFIELGKHNGEALSASMGIYIYEFLRFSVSMNHYI